MKNNAVGGNVTLESEERENGQFIVNQARNTLCELYFMSNWKFCYEPKQNNNCLAFFSFSRMIFLGK